MIFYGKSKLRQKLISTIRKKMAAVSRQYIFIQSFVKTFGITNVMKTPEER